MLSTETLRERKEWHVILLGIGGVIGVVLLIGLVLTGQVRMAVALTVFAFVTSLAIMDIKLAVAGILVYLVFMGDLRRLLIPAAGWSGTDPLLLVGPTLVLLLFGYVLASRKAQLDTALSKWIAALMVVMILQVFNPSQGGLMVGIGGMLFYLIPLLWYWIGRAYVSATFLESLVYRIVLPLAFVAALMGYYQTFYGYLPYQQQWFDVAGYTALGPQGKQSAISLFASHSEYTVFLAIAMVALWAHVLHRQQYAALAMIAFLFVAVFLTGVRGPIVKFMVTASVLWAVLGHSRKTWVVRGGLALCIGVVGLTWGLSNITLNTSNERVQHRVDRQVEGILGANEGGSSATGHVGMMLHGYKMGLQNPLGRGLGSTTKAAAKFGGEGGSMEVDSSNIFVSTGVVGGVVYLIVIFLIIRSALRYWTATRSLIALVLIGTLVVTFLGWLKGGQYAVSPLVWLCIGALDRAVRDEPTLWSHTLQTR